MCDPFLIMFAAGSVIAARQQSRAQDKARAGYMKEERLRQQAIQKGAAGSFSDTLAGFESINSPEGQQQATQNLTEQYQSAIDSGTYSDLTPTAIGGNVPEAATKAISNQVVKGVGTSRDRAAVAAALDAYGRIGGRTGRLLERGQRDLDLFKDAAAGSSQVLPMELSAASEAGRNWQTISQLFSLAGMMYGYNQAYKQPPPAGTTTTAGQGTGATQTM